ncbi:MAG: response regulator [Bdellovibrionota bacterium]
MKEIFWSKYLYVVDDTAFMRAGLIKLLIELGFDKDKILQFENGQAALNAFMLGKHVDLILSDWNMPQMTGIELLKEIRQSKSSWSQVPIVMITTVSEKDKVIEALAFKISGYLLKPVDIDKLSKTMNSVFLGENDEE